MCVARRPPTSAVKSATAPQQQRVAINVNADTLRSIILHYELYAISQITNNRIPVIKAKIFVVICSVSEFVTK